MATDLGMVVDIVDKDNTPIGIARRSEVFEKGLGFRTVHIFLFDPSGRLLLQKLPHDHLRSPGKLGSSVAGYLYSGESYTAAANRKMRVELSIDATLRRIAIWQMTDTGVSKFVALFCGTTSQSPRFDPTEIAEIIYEPLDALDFEVQRNPERFTPTFVFAYERFRFSGAAR